MMKRKVITFILGILFIMVSGIFYLCSIKKDSDEPLMLSKSKEEASSLLQTEAVISGSPNTEAMNDEETMVYVHISGAVQKQDVYQITSGSRLFEVVELAGGLQENAATQFVNLAQVVVDGEQYYIPTTEEIETNGVSMKDLYQKKSEDTTVININTADLDELCELPGVGETKAKDIIAYRETNGKFLVIEDIMNVKGIGEALFEKMKPYLRV